MSTSAAIQGPPLDWLTLLLVILLVAVTTFTCTVVGWYVLEKVVADKGRVISNGCGRDQQSGDCCRHCYHHDFGRQHHLDYHPHQEEFEMRERRGNSGHDRRSDCINRPSIGGGNSRVSFGNADEVRFYRRRHHYHPPLQRRLHPRSPLRPTQSADNVSSAVQGEGTFQRLGIRGSGSRDNALIPSLAKHLEDQQLSPIQHTPPNDGRNRDVASVESYHTRQEIASLSSSSLSSVKETVTDMAITTNAQVGQMPPMTMNSRHSDTTTSQLVRELNSSAGQHSRQSLPLSMHLGMGQQQHQKLTYKDQVTTFDDEVFFRKEELQVDDNKVDLLTGTKEGHLKALTPKERPFKDNVTTDMTRHNTLSEGQMITATIHSQSQEVTEEEADEEEAMSRPLLGDPGNTVPQKLFRGAVGRSQLKQKESNLVGVDEDLPQMQRPSAPHSINPSSGFSQTTTLCVCSCGNRHTKEETQVLLPPLPKQQHLQLWQGDRPLSVRQVKRADRNRRAVSVEQIHRYVNVDPDAPSLPSTGTVDSMFRTVVPPRQSREESQLTHNYDRNARVVGSVSPGRESLQRMGFMCDMSESQSDTVVATENDNGEENSKPPSLSWDPYEAPQQEY